MRHVRRGTTSEALASLGSRGTNALVEVLHQEPFSRGAAASNGSLVKPSWDKRFDEDVGCEQASRHQGRIENVVCLAVVMFFIMKVVLIDKIEFVVEGMWLFALPWPKYPVPR